MRMPTTRRGFLGAMSAAATAIGMTEQEAAARTDEPLAILGGKPVRSRPNVSWPIIEANDERHLAGRPPQAEMVPA